MSFFKNKIVRYCIIGIILFGIVFASITVTVNSCNKANEEKQEIIATTPTDTLQYLRTEYHSDDILSFIYFTQQKEEIVKVTYSIDNKIEKELVEVQKGKSEDANLPKEVGEFYFMSNLTQEFTRGLKVGTHIINFYVYTASGVTETVSKNFKIIDIETQIPPLT